MNLDKYTQKTLEALKAAQALALDRGSMEIRPEHVCYALVTQDGGLIGSLFGKMGIDVPGFTASLEDELSRIPGVSGPGREPGKIYVSNDTERALTFAERVAKQMKDEYVSVEHLMLGLFEHSTSGLKNLFRQYNVTKEGFMKALASVRNFRVTND
ncbi:MAG: type VI secretion system ATPase TssH, partial [Lachnospiraceae bacterium]|nr:type VI secretion system ATPase TssH [Lachnospiraceae bacterium]